MPKQHTLFGRPIPRFTTRRLALLLLGISILAVTLITTLTSAVPSSPSLSAYDRKISVPRIGDKLSNSILNPFRQPSHQPPRQENDEFAGSSWWANQKWLSVPFSSSLTLDDDRAILPPLRQRQPIYCYYDATIKKTRDEKDAESALLLTWRRAWWAKGFRPVILSASEAMKNPTYDMLQRTEVDADLKQDLMKWLAWDSMEGGILAEYTLLPTISREAPLLTYLRRGEFPSLSRWKNLGNALFTGQASDVKSALESIMNPAKLKLKTVLEAIPEESFKVDTGPAPLAYYSEDVITHKYEKVATSLKENRAKGLHSLNKLINSHLQIAWQNRFPEGIEVLKPHPEHTTAMVNGALQLARALAACPESPMPSTCPPDLPKCSPCVASKPMEITTNFGFHNSTKLYTFGTVPHPWTLALLVGNRDSLNATWIRRESKRDSWLNTVTQQFLGGGVSNSRRVMRLKEAIAGEHATAYSLWLTAETDMPTDLDWRFGFTISKHAMDTGKSESPVPSDHIVKKVKPDRVNGPPASEEDVVRERARIELAKKVVAQIKSTDETKMRASLEAWNMADTETWKFVRAFWARENLERSQWEKEEAKYSNGAGSERGRTALSRWQDRKD